MKSKGMWITSLFMVHVATYAYQQTSLSEASNRIGVKLNELEMKTNAELNLSQESPSTLFFEGAYLPFNYQFYDQKLSLDHHLMLSSKDYRQKLRDFFTVHVTDKMQLGFDSFKVEPIGVKKSEILHIGALQPKHGGTKSARGYGLELTVTLD